MNTFLGVYGGLVEENRDPDQIGRIKVRVPATFGNATEVPTDKLPWALPRGLPYGNSKDSGGISWLPAIGDTVWVTFLDGEPEKPLWEWAVAPKQVQKNAIPLKLHEYSADQGGYPDRVILTRYGHSIEIKPTQITITTSEGQQILLQTSKSASGGSAALQTPIGQRVTLNDTSQTIVIQAVDTAVMSAPTVQVNAPTSALVKTERMTIMAGASMIVIEGNTIIITTGSGATMLIDDSGNVSIGSASGACLSLEDKVQLGEPLGAGIVIENGKVSVNAPSFIMNTAACSIGTGAGFPVLLLNPQMLAWLIGHTHTNGNDGSPTGPPILTDPQFPQDASSKTMHTT
jgi:hypothetical protein